MTPLAYLRHVFEVTGDPRVPVWPRRWRQRAEDIAEDEEIRMAMRKHEQDKARGRLPQSIPVAEFEALAFPARNGVSTVAYTSRKRDG